MAGCRVAVGTSNQLKLRAVARAFTLLCNPVDALMVSVGGPTPQPVGLESVVRGAVVRARKALEEAGGDYGGGVGAGPFTLGRLAIELQAAAVVDRQRRVSLGLSQAFMVPSAWAGSVLKGVELGSIAEERTGRRGIGRTHGVIAYLTSGLVSRGDLTYEATLMALVPRLNPELYELPAADELLRSLGG